MVLFGSKKALGGKKALNSKKALNLKLDDYVNSKIFDLKEIAKNNKTLFTFLLIGCAYYFYKSNSII